MLVSESGGNPPGREGFLEELLQAEREVLGLEYSPSVTYLELPKLIPAPASKRVTVV